MALARKTLAQILSHTRGSAGFYMAANGLLTLAATDTVRIEHNALTGERLGFLIEKGATNLLTQSQTLSDLVFTALTGSDNTDIAPDGTLTADKVVCTSGNSQHRDNQTVTYSAGLVCLSRFVKMSGMRYCSLRLTATTGGTDGCSFDLQTGTIGPLSGTAVRAGMDQLKNGWWRIWVACEALADDTPRFNINNSFTLVSSFAGNDTDGMLIWGRQLETGGYPSSYIATVASTVTRAADNALISVSGLIGGEGSLMVEGRILGTPEATDARIISMKSSVSGDVNERAIYFNSDTLQMTYESITASVSQCQITGPIQDAPSDFKIAARWKANDFAAFFNGELIGPVDTSGTVPTDLDTIRLGSATGLANMPSGLILKDLQLFPVAFNDTRLMALSAV